MIALLRAVSGLILWAIAFSSLYALQGLACALGWDGVGFAGVSAARLALVLLYAGWTSALLWLCWYLYPQKTHRDFLSHLAFACAIIGLLSTLYTGAPVVVTTTCSYIGSDGADLALYPVLPFPETGLNVCPTMTGVKV